MEGIIDRLKGKGVRNSTNANYLSVWRHFNRFLIRLDDRPKSWEDRVALFCAYLIEDGAQSQTVKSYVSGIKAVLKEDGYDWNENKILISSLTRACKVQNDKVKCRFPIKKGLLELILFEIKRVLPGQIYLQILYRAIFSIGYYGLMRIGELTESSHTLKACNIHVGLNKDKIMLVLRSSKTHGLESYPQKIKIAALNEEQIHKQNNGNPEQSLFCPFELAREYMEIRGDYVNENENFFIFRDRSNVLGHHARGILKQCIANLKLDSSLYNFQSLRAGRSCDYLKEGLSIEEISRAGRWQSNAVYKYLRQ